MLQAEGMTPHTTSAAAPGSKPKVAVLGELLPFLVHATQLSLILHDSTARIIGHDVLPKYAAGAAGGIGQPLALLLKGSPLIGELSLYDIVGTEGVGADLSHIDSSVKVGRPPLQLLPGPCSQAQD